MTKYEDNCVGCPTNMGCIRGACPYANVPVVVCDSCGYEGAEYKLDGVDVCEGCFEENVLCTLYDMSLGSIVDMLQKNMTLEEIADMLELDWEKQIC